MIQADSTSFSNLDSSVRFARFSLVIPVAFSLSHLSVVAHVSLCSLCTGRMETFY